MIPELRFPKFEGGFSIHSFNDLFEFSTGKNIKQSEVSPEFETPCVRYGELYHMYNEVIKEVINKTNLDKNDLLFSNGDEILLPSAGEDPLDIGSASALTLSGIAIGRTINILKPKADSVYSQIFVSYYINLKLKRKISSLAKGVSISNVYNSDLKKLTATLPSIPEQQKIASFLTSIDERIRLLRDKKAQLLQYKKGIMQQLFTSPIEGGSRGVLRFRDGNENNYPDWEEKKLDEIGSFIGGGTPDSTVVHYWDGNIPWISSSDIEGESITDISMTRFISKEAVEQSATKLIPANSVLMVSRVGIGKFAVSPVDLCTSQDFTSMVTLQNPKYLAYMFTFRAKEFLKVSQGTSIKGFTSSDVKNMKFEIPSLPEQQKIASFLSAIDDSISQVTDQITQTEHFKKGLLQKMFV